LFQQVNSRPPGSTWGRLHTTCSINTHSSTSAIFVQKEPSSPCFASSIHATNGCSSLEAKPHQTIEFRIVRSKFYQCAWYPSLLIFPLSQRLAIADCALCADTNRR
jgi:hypothetical protein